MTNTHFASAVVEIEGVRESGEEGSNQGDGKGIEKRAACDESSMDDEDNEDTIEAAKIWSLGKSLGLWAKMTMKLPRL